MLEAVLWGRHVTDQLVLATFARIAPVFAPVLARSALPDCLSNGSLAARAAGSYSKDLLLCLQLLMFFPLRYSVSKEDLRLNSWLREAGFKEWVLSQLLQRAGSRRHSNECSEQGGGECGGFRSLYRLWNEVLSTVSWRWYFPSPAQVGSGEHPAG